MDHLYTQSTPFFHWLESLPDFTLEATGEQPAPSTSKSSESTPPHTAFDKHHESLHTVYPHLSYTQPALLLEPTPPTTHSGPSTMEPPHPQRPTRVDSSSDPSAIDDTDQTPRAPATQRRRGNDGSVSPSKRQQQQRIPRGSVSGAASRALANPGALSPPPFPTGVEMYAISRQLSEQSLDPRDSTSQRDAISQRTGSQATSASNPTGTGTGVSSKALDDYTLHNLPFLNPPAQLSTVSSWRTARPRIFRKLPPRVRVLYELVTTAIYCEAYIPLSVQSSLRDHLRRRDEAHLIPASMAFLPDTEELDVRWPQLRDMVRDLEPTDEASLMMLIVHPLLNIATRIFKESFIGLSDFEARAEESDAHPAALDGVSESLPPLPSPRPILPNGRPLSDRSVDVLVMSNVRMSDPHWIPQINSQNRRPRRQGQRIDLALSVPFSDVLRSPGTSPVSSASNTPAPSLPNPFSQRPWRPDFSALLFGDCDATGVTTSLNNQIAHPNHGLFAYLELKKSAHTKDPQIQLSTWALSEHIKMQAMGWDVGIPRLAIAVMDVTWHAYLVFWDEQSSYGKLAVLGPIVLGHTADELSILRLLHVVGKIVEWGATTWADMFYEGTISRLGRVAEERARKQHEAQEANDENLREAIRTTALQSGGTAVGTTS